jgi:hypothetical protein|tara:strand:+ start:36 stop:311 length:276 start_codon:yes stop_codon:yes gene_type:complete
MGKANRATRKELEEVIGKLIQEIQFLRQGFTALDNYLGAYVKYKGDTIAFSDFIKKEYEKAQNNEQKLEPPKEREKIDKKDRYKKVSTPPL